MFSSKIVVLSVFVFSLFALGQAAPILDDMSSLSAREASDSLVTRNFFTNLFHKGKVDLVTKNVTQTAHCQVLHTLLRSKKEYLAAQLEFTTKKDALIAKGSKAKDPTVKEYVNQIKMFSTLAKKMESAAAKKEKALKKLDFKGGRTQCKAVAAAKASATSAPTSHPTHTSTSTHTSQPTPTSHSSTEKGEDD